MIVYVLAGVVGYVAGVVTGLCVFWPWGYWSGHLDGYQDHRAEVNDRKARAELERTPGTELEPVRSKTAPVPGWYTSRAPAAVPGGGRPFPPASPRTHTTAADITRVTVPPAGPTAMIRPQPGRDSGAGTATMPRIDTTGDMLAVTDSLIAQIEAGTWPPSTAGA